MKFDSCRQPLHETMNVLWKLFYYHTDANKNVTELTDSNGAVVAHYEYSPFGEILTSTGAYAATNPFRFSSEYYDDESELVYYNYRYYSPELGRWLSRDPVEEQGGVNLYETSQNNTISFFDLLGKDSFTVEDMETSIGGAGLGHSLHVKGKTLLYLDQGFYYMQYTSPGSANPNSIPTGILWIYKKGDKSVMYRLDNPHRGASTVHHNTSGNIQTFSGLKVVNHASYGAKAFKQEKEKADRINCPPVLSMAAANVYQRSLYFSLGKRTGASICMNSPA